MQTDRPIILIGAGGLCVDILETIDFYNSQHEQKMTIAGILDNDPAKKESFSYSDVRIIGSQDDIEKYTSDHSFLVTFSSPEWFLSRQEFTDSLTSNYPTINFINLIDPRAYVSRTTKLGTGNFIGPGVYLGPEVQIGNHNILLFNSIVSRYCTLGDHNFLSANINITGKKNIGSENYLGVNSTINADIGSHVFLSTNAVIKKSVDGPQIIDTDVTNKAIEFTNVKRMKKSLGRL